MVFRSSFGCGAFRYRCLSHVPSSAQTHPLPRLARRAGVDVLWSPGYTAPFRCAAPQVVTMHDMQYKRFPSDVTWLAARTMDVLYPGAARHCAAKPCASRS